MDICEVNRMVKQFNETKKMMKQLPGMMGGKGGKKGRFKTSLLTHMITKQIKIKTGGEKNGSKDQIKKNGTEESSFL